MTTLCLSPDQQAALDIVVAKIEMKEQCVTVGGYAGTGKTTLTGEIVRALRPKFPKIAFCCFTGKAYKVLEAKLKNSGTLDFGDYCGTIHSLVYDARRKRIQKQKDGETIQVNRMQFMNKDENEKYDLIVVDEASMVNEELYNKLLEFGVPILAIGDHGQLPPVKGQFNLMDNPQIRLTKIHRQAEDDPIIRLSIMAREDGKIPFGNYGLLCKKTQSEEEINSIPDPLNWMIIAGTNRKRVERNKWARWRLGQTGALPNPGDRVVCLKNIHAREVFNGMTGTVTKIGPSDFLVQKYKVPHFVHMDVRMDTETDYFSKEVFKYQFHSPKPLMETVAEARDVDPDDFGHLWDFGYCLTAHKAQGSEWENVIVYEEKSMQQLMSRTMGDEGWRRWLYTAVTRAKKQLIIVGE